jgi:hypothetical protein
MHCTYQKKHTVPFELDKYIQRILEIIDCSRNAIKIGNERLHQAYETRFGKGTIIYLNGKKLTVVGYLEHQRKILLERRKPVVRYAVPISDVISKKVSDLDQYIYKPQRRF